VQRIRTQVVSALLGVAVAGVALAILALSGPATPRAVAQTSPIPAPRQALGLEIVAHHDLGQRTGGTSEVFYMKGIAYVAYRCARDKGTSFVDVSDPAAPNVVFVTEPISGTFADDVWGLPDLRTASFQGDLLVESHDRCVTADAPMVRFWDVTDPRQPALLSSFNSVDGVHNHYAFTRVEAGLTKAYVILAAPGADSRDNAAISAEDRDLDADFVVLDITDPRQPTVAGKWNAHDDWQNIPGRKWADVPPAGANISIFQHDTWANAAGTIGYGAYWDAGMIMLDIRDLANIEPISSFSYADVQEGNTHGVVLSKNEDYAVLTDEDYSASKTVFEVLEPQSLAGVKASLGGQHATGSFSGELVFVGRGCDADPAYNLTQPDPYLGDASGKVAVIARGGCTFAGKINEAQKHGAIGAVIVNNAAGTVVPPMGGAPRADTTISGIGISGDDGNAITMTLAASTTVRARLDVVADEVGYTRIVDIRDPANPREVAEFTIPETRMFPPPAGSTQFGYSVHNAWVVGDEAYLASYDGGVRIVDISDPTRPRETAHLIPADRSTGPNPEDRVRSTMWGIITDERGLMYASDINNGLWILRKTSAAATPTVGLPTVAPTAAPTAPPPTAPPFAGRVCPQIFNHVPAAAINVALSDPARITGYNELLAPGKPESPRNPRRTWLSMRDIASPYHPLYNGLVYRAGCP